MEQTKNKWEVKSHSHQIADTGDYDGHYELTNGKVSIFTKDEPDDDFKGIIDALNESEINFYLDDTNDFLVYHFQEENKKLEAENLQMRDALYCIIGRIEGTEWEGLDIVQAVQKIKEYASNGLRPLSCNTSDTNKTNEG